MVYLGLLLHSFFYKAIIKLSSMKGISSEGLTGEECVSKLTHVTVGRIWLLMGNWTGCLSSSLPVGQKSPLVPCHKGLSHNVTCFIKTNKVC